MARLVHITADTDAARIRRNGIRLRRLRFVVEGEPGFVWAFPPLPSYTLTHQWARELKRWGRHTLAAVTFVLPDDEPVYVRHYRDELVRMRTAEACGLIARMSDPRGYEVLVPRRIEAREIASVRTLPQAVGWRYYPGVKNSDYRACECPACAPRGEVKARRYRERIPLMQARWEARRSSDGS